MKDKTMLGKRYDKEHGTIWTCEAVAREAGVLGCSLRNWIREGKFCPPTIENGKRHYYSHEQARGILRQIKRHCMRDAEREQLWTSAALARELGVCRPSWDMHRSLGNIPSPAIDGRYNTAQAAVIRRFFTWRQKLQHDCAQLTNGLQQIGASKAEAAWVYRHQHLFPDIPPVLGGVGKKSRYYTWQQLHQILRRCRLVREAMPHESQKRNRRTGGLADQWEAKMEKHLKDSGKWED